MKEHEPLYSTIHPMKCSQSDVMWHKSKHPITSFIKECSYQILLEDHMPDVKINLISVVTKPDKRYQKYYTGNSLDESKYDNSFDKSITLIGC